MSNSQDEYFTEWVHHWTSTSLNLYFTRWVLDPNVFCEALSMKLGAPRKQKKNFEIARRSDRVKFFFKLYVLLVLLPRPIHKKHSISNTTICSGLLWISMSETRYIPVQGSREKTFRPPPGRPSCIYYFFIQFYFSSQNFRLCRRLVLALTYKINWLLHKWPWLLSLRCWGEWLVCFLINLKQLASPRWRCAQLGATNVQNT